MNARQQAKKPRLRSLKAHSSKKSEGVRRTIAVDFHGVSLNTMTGKGKALSDFRERMLLGPCMSSTQRAGKSLSTQRGVSRSYALTLSTIGSRTMRSIGTPIIVLWV